jgi:hypothetical protein
MGTNIPPTPLVGGTLGEAVLIDLDVVGTGVRRIVVEVVVVLR